MKLTIIAVLIILCAVSVVSAENTYVPVEQTTQSYGNLYVTDRCHNNLFSHEMILINLTNNESESIFLNPDGKYDTQIVPGEYSLILLDGNAGHSEYQHFIINAGWTTYVNFIGHAISSDSIPETSATYGITKRFSPDDCGRLYNGDMTGITVDVTSDLDTAIAKGYTSFIFDNRPQPGGIWSTTGLLVVPIIDPDYCFIKHVHIKYKNKVIDAQEYATITLP